MENKRTAGQTFIGCWCDKPIVEAIDRQKKRPEFGGERSSFLRSAIADKLADCDDVLAAGLFQRPDRTGKGGRKKKKFDPPKAIQAGIGEINQTLSSRAEKKARTGTG